MAKITKLEDLQAWKEAIRLAILIYKYTKLLPESEKYNIKKHMEGCARNIPANIAEGFGRYYYKESKQFYRIASGSLEELKSDTCLCLGLKYFAKRGYQEITDQIEKVGRLLTGLKNSAKKVKKYC